MTKMTNAVLNGRRMQKIGMSGLMRTTRSVSAALMAVATIRVSFGADFHWTGNGGDCKWSNPGNWADSNGNPKDAAPSDGNTYSYNFANYNDGDVILMDVNVQTHLFAIGHDADSQERTLTWKSIDNKTFKLVKKDEQDPKILLNTKNTLILECDMSSDDAACDIIKERNGVLAFRLSKANAGRRKLSVCMNYQSDADIEDTVKFLAGGETPRIGVSLVGSTSRLINENDGTVLTYLLSDPAQEGSKRNGQVITDGKTLTLGVPDVGSASTNNLKVGIFAKNGTLALQNERILSTKTLPIGGCLDLRRSDYLLERDPLTAIRWTFDNANDITYDPVGSGGRMLTKGGVPASVLDDERGRVVEFKGECFMGPDADAGFAPLTPWPGAGNPFAVSFWVKPAANCSRIAKLIFWGVQEQEKAVALRFNDAASQKLMFSIWGDGRNYLADTQGIDPFDGKWHHVAVTYNGRKLIRAFLDGKRVLNVTANVTIPPNRNFYIGRMWGGWATDGNNPYYGRMDDVLVGAYWLSDEQVASLYAGNLSDIIRASDFIAESSGTLSLPQGSTSLRTLSGQGLLGGVEMRGENGNTLTVGADDATGTNKFAATIRGGETTLRKVGANYAQELNGRADAVKKIEVKEGVLSIRRPQTRKGMILKYSFDRADSLCADSSVSDLTMTATGAPAAVEDGVVGGAIHFDGASYLRSGAAHRPGNMPCGNHSYTVSLWIRPTAAACANQAPLMSWGGSSSHNLSYLRFQSANEMRFSNYDEDLSATGLDNLADGKWHHVVAVFDSEKGAKRFYLDGELKAKKDSGVELNVYRNRELFIGHGIVNDKSYEGDLDEFQLFDYAMTAQEVADEFARRPVAAVDEAILLPVPVARWTFDDESAPGKDSSGNGHDLTANGEVSLETQELSSGKAFRSSASGGYFTLPTVPASFPSGEGCSVTVVMRVLADTVQDQDGYSTILSWGDSGNLSYGGLIKIGTEKGNGMLRSYLVQDVTEIPSTSSSAVGAPRQRWATLAVMWTPNEKAAVYLDGELVVSHGQGRSMNLQARDFAIGAMADGSRHFRGLIDEVRVYDTSLSAGQMRVLAEQLANGGQVPKVLSRNPDVEVSENATLELDANEMLSSLSGAGTVKVGVNAMLNVMNLGDFSGRIAGDGSFAVPAGSTIRVRSFDELPFADVAGGIALGENVVVDIPRPPEVRQTLLVAGSGFVGAENLSSWIVRCNGRVKGTVRISRDGKSLIIVPNDGLSIIIR